MAAKTTEFAEEKFMRYALKWNEDGPAAIAGFSAACNYSAGFGMSMTDACQKSFGKALESKVEEMEERMRELQAGLEKVEGLGTVEFFKQLVMKSQFRLLMMGVFAYFADTLPHYVGFVGALAMLLLWMAAERNRVGWGLLTLGMFLLGSGYYCMLIFPGGAGNIAMMLTIALLCSNALLKLSRHDNPLTRVMKGLYGH